MPQFDKALTENQLDMQIETFIRFLQKKTLKLTEQRKTIADWAFRQEHHFTADSIVAAFFDRRKVSKATIYRTLSLLVEANLLVVQDFGEGYKTYENKLHDVHHDHLICLYCHSVIEFLNLDIEAIQEDVAKRYNYVLKSHTMKLYGICPSCQHKPDD